MSSKLIVGVMAMLMFWSVPELAAQQTGRYVLKQTGDGFVRLDTETGSVAHCRKADGQWQCDDLDEGSSGSRAEMTRLMQKNSELEKRVAALETKLRALRADRRADGKEPDSKLRLPSDDEIDQIMGFFEKFVMRFMEFARRLKDPPGEDI